jgi:hypothetical protein
MSNLHPGLSRPPALSRQGAVQIAQILDEGGQNLCMFFLDSQGYSYKA